MPLISVLMSTKNGEKTLPRALDSILNQTLTDLELIVCDDGSTDGTAALLEGYRQKDPRVIVLRNETSLGLACSLNRCFKASSGGFLARMDDDDISLPHRFEAQIGFLREHSEYAFVGSNAIVFDEKRDIGHMVKPATPTRKHFVKGSPYLHPSVMFRREALEQVNGYSEEPYAVRRAQDYELFMRMFAQGLYGYTMQEPLMKYYYSQSVTQKKRSFQSVKDEMTIRRKGYRQMKVPFWCYAFCFLPVYVYFKHEIIRRRNERMEKKKAGK